MFHLALLLRRRGRLREAESWHKRISSAERSLEGRSDIYYSYAELLAEAGRREEAETYLRGALANGDWGAGVALAGLLADSGRADEAIPLWEDAASRGDLNAHLNLGAYFRKEGNIDHAESWYRKAASIDSSGASALLGAMLLDNGRQEEGVALLRLSVDEGDSAAAYELGKFLLGSNKLDEAAECFRRAAAGGEALANGLMAQSLEGLGREREAEYWWVAAADAGDNVAAFRLGQLYIEDRPDEAVMRLEQAARGGSLEAACELGEVLCSRGDHEEGRGWLVQAFAEGEHAHAACVMGWSFERQQRFDEAEHAYRRAMNFGHEHAAQMLSPLLARLGRGRAAADALRRANGHGGPSRSGGRSRKARKGSRGGRRKK
nr:tetratricopeptide repeat protein [Geodermatophilus sabuli]